MNRYNGATVKTEVIHAGTEVWRVFQTADLLRYPPHEFRQTGFPPLIDASTIRISATQGIPIQGRFDPIPGMDMSPTSSAGGYVYVGKSISAVVAEGVIRNASIPPSGRLSRNVLKGKSIVRMITTKDIDVIPLDDHMTRVAASLDASVYGCTWRDYRETRIISEEMLNRHPDSYGIQYNCRHYSDAIAIMMVDRMKDGYLKQDGPSYPLDSANQMSTEVIDTLNDEFGLTVGP